MIQEKNLAVANFNLTFGEKNRPMLEHFEDIIYPALKESESRTDEKGYYNFENITLTMKNGIFVLGGLLVKNTHLEVFSNYDEEGTLQRQNNVFPTAPYSYFMINLKNHRMTLVQNQRGSPTLKDFEKAAGTILKKYVNEENNVISDENQKLPAPYLDIVSIPHSGKIREELKRVTKIENLTMRFYPLNGDVSTNETFNHLREMLEQTESKSGNAQINSPKNIDEVGEVLEETKGLIKPVLRVVYPNDTKRTLRASNFSETTKIKLDDKESFTENLDTISGKVITQQEYTETSEENSEIYGNKFTRLEEMYRKE